MTTRLAWERLYEGEDFEIGEFRGTIDRIHARSVEILDGTERILVRYGQSIAEGKVLSQSDVAAAGS